MSNNRVLHAKQENVHVLRFVGDIRYPMSPSVDQFLDELFSAATPDGFVIDLTEAHTIDSTNLGLLARVATRMRECGGPRVVIISAHGDINEILMTVGFDEVFDIREQPVPDVCNVTALPIAEVDRETMSHTILKAHRTLMDLNEHNRAQFCEVVTVLEHTRAN
jgi:anti-anti-sigma factor